MTGTPRWDHQNVHADDTRPTLGLDLDGVVACFSTAFQAVAERLANRPLPVIDPAAWSLSDRFGVSPALVDEVFTVGVSSGELFSIAPPIHEQIAAVRHLQDQGWRVHIVTARPDPARDATEWWLAEHNVPYDALTLTSDKHTVTGLTVLVDDMPLNVERHLAHHGPGAACLVDADWNRDRTDLPRIRSLREVTTLTVCA